MKEATNETSNTWIPSGAEMNEMYQNAWLNFHADAQEAKQKLDRRYARLVNHFGDYKKMPQEMKDMFKDEYAQYKAKWGKNGEEQEKRFGSKVTKATTESKQSKQSEDRQELKQKFLQDMKMRHNQKEGEIKL